MTCFLCVVLLVFKSHIYGCTLNQDRIMRVVFAYFWRSQLHNAICWIFPVWQLMWHVGLFFFWRRGFKIENTDGLGEIAITKCWRVGAFTLYLTASGFLSWSAKLIWSSRMSYKTAGILGRVLLQSGNRTPPLARSLKLQNYSKCSSCGVSNQEGKSKPCTSASPTSPAAHRHQVGGKKRTEETLTLSGRSYSSTALKVDQKTYLWARYSEMKRLVHGM